MALADRDFILAYKGLTRIARIEAAAGTVTSATAFLEGILTGKWTVAEGGRELISSSENGKSATVAIPEGMASLNLMALAEAALQYLEGYGRITVVKTRFTRV